MNVNSQNLSVALLIPGRRDDQCAKRYNDILEPSAQDRLRDWTPSEDQILRDAVRSLGHSWSAISTRLDSRPPLTCRNRWRALSRKENEPSPSGDAASQFSAVPEVSTEGFEVGLDLLTPSGTLDLREMESNLQPGLSQGQSSDGALGQHSSLLVSHNTPSAECTSDDYSSIAAPESTILSTPRPRLRPPRSIIDKHSTFVHTSPAALPAIALESAAPLTDTNLWPPLPFDTMSQDTHSFNDSWLNTISETPGSSDTQLQPPHVHIHHHYHYHHHHHHHHHHQYQHHGNSHDEYHHYHNGTTQGSGHQN